MSFASVVYYNYQRLGHYIDKLSYYRCLLDTYIAFNVVVINFAAGTGARRQKTLRYNAHAPRTPPRV